jgi:predicted transcriptional regulator
MPKAPTEQVMVRVERGTKRQLVQIAEREDRSVSSLIRLAVLADLDRRSQGAAAA